jgi:hypothetical protein
MCANEFCVLLYYWDSLTQDGVLVRYTNKRLRILDGYEDTLYRMLVGRERSITPKILFTHFRALWLLERLQHEYLYHRTDIFCARLHISSLRLVFLLNVSRALQLPSCLSQYRDVFDLYIYTCIIWQMRTSVWRRKTHVVTELVPTLKAPMNVHVDQDTPQDVNHPNVLVIKKYIFTKHIKLSFFSLTNAPNVSFATLYSTASYIYVHYFPLDVDECKADTNLCAFRCINTPGSFRCHCPRGFELAGDGRHCRGKIK